MLHFLCCSAGVDVACINNAAQALKLALQDWLSEAELGQTVSSYDADGSGDISFDEFVHMVRPAVYTLQQLRSLLTGASVPVY